MAPVSRSTSTAAHCTPYGKAGSSQHAYASAWSPTPCAWAKRLPGRASPRSRSGRWTRPRSPPPSRPRSEALRRASEGFRGQSEQPLPQRPRASSTALAPIAVSGRQTTRRRRARWRIAMEDRDARIVDAQRVGTDLRERRLDPLAQRGGAGVHGDVAAAVTDTRAYPNRPPRSSPRSLRSPCRGGGARPRRPARRAGRRRRSARARGPTAPGSRHYRRRGDGRQYRSHRVRKRLGGSRFRRRNSVGSSPIRCAAMSSSRSRAKWAS